MGSYNLYFQATIYRPLTCANGEKKISNFPRLDYLKLLKYEQSQNQNTVTFTKSLS